MAKWRCLWASISLSRRLGGCSTLAALAYTWGIAHGDAYGLMRRDDVRLKVLGRRRVSPASLERAIDELIALGLLCQPRYNDDAWLHWCGWDAYQGEQVRKRTVAPRFNLICTNEKRGNFRAVAEKSAKTKTKTKTKTAAPPTPPNGPPSSEEKTLGRLMEAVVAIWPGAGAVFYQGYTDLEDEYGIDFIWECWKAALESGQTKASVRYLEAIARRCKAEGKKPGQKEDLHGENRRDAQAGRGPGGSPGESARRLVEQRERMWA